MSLTIDLPVELCEQIIDHALDSRKQSQSISDALNFALVSGKWTPRSRYHLELSLDESRVKVQQLRLFTDLCQHPLNTFKYVGSLSVSNIGNTRVGLKRSPQDHPAVNVWFSRQFRSEGKKTILESVFTQLKTLTIERVGWWTLNGMARGSLHNGFQLVTKLVLRNVSFMEFSHFHELICSFPMLEKLHLALIQSLPSNPTSLESVKDPDLELPMNLHSIEILTSDLATLAALSMITPCPSLRHLKWQSIAFYQLDEECRVVGKLLASADSSLVELSIMFDVDSLSNDINIRRPNMEVATLRFQQFHDCVDLAKNCSLEKLTLDIRPDPYLVLFLKHSFGLDDTPLSSNKALSIQSLCIPYLENVIFSLKTHVRPSDGLKESDLDVGLQHPALANTQKLNFELQGFFPRDSAVEKIGQILSGLVNRSVLLEPIQ